MFIYLSPPSAPVCAFVCLCVCETRSVITPFLVIPEKARGHKSCNAAAVCVMNMQRKYQFVLSEGYNECMVPGKILLSWSDAVHFPLHSLPSLPLLRGCNYAKSNFIFQVCKYQYRLATNRQYKGDVGCAMATPLKCPASTLFQI